MASAFPLELTSIPVIALLGTFPLLLFALIEYRRRKDPLANVRGPPSKSWMLGATEELYTTEMSKVQASWTEKYGPVVSFKACLGEQWLLITDPKALHYMQTKPYLYGKHQAHGKRTQAAIGYGLSSVDGDLHKRLRRIMLPSFGWAEINSMSPMFWGIMERLTAKWQRKCDEAKENSIELDITKETAKIALDAVSDATLGYHFHAVESGNDDGFAYRLSNLIPRAFGQPNKTTLTRVSLLNRLPEWLSSLVVRAPNAEEKDKATFAAKNLATLKSIASKLVADRRNENIDNEKNLLARMMRSGNNAKNKMSEEELIYQVITFFFAGEDTTATVLACMFHELAQKPDLQTAIRNEVEAAHQAALAEGLDHIPAQVLNTLPLVDAMVKECLRLYIPVPRRDRYMTGADVLPLSKPLIGRNGEKIESLYLPKGTSIMLGIQEYNRSEAIWGSDSRTFRPERWQEKAANDVLAQDALPGVWSNLLSFGCGAYACIGYRFALLEMKTTLAGLIRPFKFNQARPDGVKIRMENGLLDFPRVINEEEKGRFLPVRIEKLDA